MGKVKQAGLAQEKEYGKRCKGRVWLITIQARWWSVEFKRMNSVENAYRCAYSITINI